jgi:hypothetical protein
MIVNKDAHDGTMVVNDEGTMVINSDNDGTMVINSDQETLQSGMGTMVINDDDDDDDDDEGTMKSTFIFSKILSILKILHYTSKNLASTSKSANKPSTSCVPIA